MQQLVSRRDPIVLFGVLVIAVLAVLLIVSPLVIYPNEDAAILFQFARNLAGHGVISYNLADGRAEGVTDFLWLLLIGGLTKLGIVSHFAANLVSAAAFLATVLAAWRSGLVVRPLALAVFTIGLAVAPMFPAAIGGFSTLVFGFVALVTVLWAMRLDSGLFYALGVLCCLVRPDGVVPVGAAFLCRAALIAAHPNDGSWRREIIGVLAAAGLGGAYFLWRWRYFGEVFPLPFVVKSVCGAKVFGVCADSVKTEQPFLLLTAASAVVSLWIAAPERRRAVGIVLICLCAAPLAFYAEILLQQNIADRFFYPVYLGALGAYATALSDARALRPRILWSVSLAALLFALPTLAQTPLYWAKLRNQWANNTVPIARGMKALSPVGKLGVTEAGLLPYESSWPTVDLWGLNTRRYAHYLITPDDIRRERFDVIVVHPANDTASQLQSLVDHCPTQVRTERTWDNLVSNTLMAACEEGLDHYDLFIVPNGDPRRVLPVISSFVPNEHHNLYLVRRDYAGRGAMRRLLLDNYAVAYSPHA
jgi:hypothetical protein